uniref:Putative WW-binding domain-containing protein n=1 Tax=Amphiprion ocellaris TaxID=80972 RepID=A0A3Q1BGU9_AMPOC
MLDTNTDDCTYNSFQYWRVPLPELDLSLLEDTGDHSQSKEKLQTKDSSSDVFTRNKTVTFTTVIFLFVFFKIASFDLCFYQILLNQIN